MIATVVDLRYRMNEVLKALDRKERVTITHHGKVKGVIEPLQSKQAIKVENHPFFGMRSEETLSVEAQMEDLRGYRGHAV
jgi:antitoxin (DNA-binding transcriptional repressor) of toxin-antitoxin stability system